MIWVTKNVNQARKNCLLNYVKMACHIFSLQLSQEVSSDLLARLTAMPFWLDQGGRFDMPKAGQGGQVRESPIGHYLVSPKIG